ncbi:MAG: DUF502 domain-containing protein [Saprospiraceae bacterium]
MSKLPLRLKVFLRRLNRFFITTVIGGVVIILPLSIFIFLVRVVVGFTANLVRPIMGLLNLTSTTHQWLVDIVSFIIVVSLFFIIGLIVRTELGKQLFHLLEENWLSKLPFYSTLRDTVQQFAGSGKTPFQQVVLVDPFGSGVLMTGFVAEKLTPDIYSIFVPTGPNPTNGFIFHVPIEKIKFVKTKAEDAMRTIIGVGTGSSILFQPNIEKNVLKEQ